MLKKIGPYLCHCMHLFLFDNQRKNILAMNFWIFSSFFFQIGAQYTLLPPIIVSFGVIRKSFAVLHSNLLGVLEITRMLCITSLVV